MRTSILRNNRIQLGHILSHKALSNAMIATHQSLFGCTQSFDTGDLILELVGFLNCSDLREGPSALGCTGDVEEGGDVSCVTPIA